MNNMEIYDKVRMVPEEAKKTINAGRLKGMTDINPMFRIKRLTEVFGPCGIGWYPKTTKEWLETAPNGEIKVFVNIELYYKIPGTDTWSAPLEGKGGSSFVANEKNGIYVSDECYKMAYTDAIGTAAKLLGVAADVYYAKDRTKYSTTETASETAEQEVAEVLDTIQAVPKEYKCCDCGTPFQKFSMKNGREFSAGQAYHMAESANIDGKPRCRACALKAGTRKEKTANA